MDAGKFTDRSRYRVSLSIVPLAYTGIDTGGGYVLRDLQLALIRVQILQWASREPVYGVRILEELAEQGHPLGAGTLYPMLHQLEGEGLLVRQNRLIDGRIRKYYVATNEAQPVLRQAAGWLSMAQHELPLQLQPQSQQPPQRLGGIGAAAYQAGPEHHQSRSPAAPLISVRELHAWQLVPVEVRPAIVDVRTQAEYAGGHIPNAGNIPFEELPRIASELPPSRPLVTYCTMQHRGSSRSERAAHLLNVRGFRAWVLDGGIPAWSAASLPLVSGAVED